MELLTFIVVLLLMIMSMQYQVYWMMFFLGAVLIFLGKDMKTFIIVLVIMILLYFIAGTPYESYGIYIAAGGVILYMVTTRNEQDAYNPNDQYADLLKGLGG